MSNETDSFKRFLDWANSSGYDAAYTYDTERSKYLALSPMTNDLWGAWQAAIAAQNQTAQHRNMVRQRAEDVVRAFELLGAARGIAEDHQARLECEGTMVALKNALNAQPKREPVRLTPEAIHRLCCITNKAAAVRATQEEVLKANGVGGE